LIKEALALGAIMTDAQKVHEWTMHGQVGNWSIEKTVQGTDEQVARHIQELNGLFGAPTITATAANSTTAPASNSQPTGSEPRCPEHGQDRPMRWSGKNKQWFCPSTMMDYPRDYSGEKEWCKYIVTSV
jgi:hypothetical protein